MMRNDAKGTLLCDTYTSSMKQTLAVTYQKKSCFCPQFVTDNESALQQVKAMLTSTQKDKLELANQLEEEKR